MINLIMPMAGEGSRFAKNGIYTPKPLIEIKGKPFFYWSAQSILKNVEIKELVFVVLERHINENNIDKVIKTYYPQAKIVVLKEVLQGAVLTCMQGLQVIGNDYPILFNDCDHMFEAKSFYEYCKLPPSLDSALLTFFSDDPKFSYVKIDDKGYIIKTVEKEVISNQAVCGAYYFKNKDIFKNAVETYLHNCEYKEYFVSGVYNILFNQGYKGKPFMIDWHVSFGTPEEFKQAENSEFFIE